MAKPSPFRWPLQCHPEIRIVARSPFSPESVHREYRHPTFALHQHFYRGALTLAGTTIRLRPGDLTITPPDTPSSYQLEDAGFHWCVHFFPMAMPPGAATFHLPLHLPMYGGGGPVSERMREIFESSRPQGNRKTISAIATATSAAMFQALLLHLAALARQPRPARVHKRRSDSALDAIKARIDEEFHRISFSVAELARSSKLSRNYFSARFRERFGLTVDGYVLQRRLEMARTLLISTALPMKEIAYECGIPDPNYFNKQFRHSIGLSPSAYRAQNL
ncbi:hypothetical protein BH09VER1_BH09VER1_39890 [soil metagenome]